MTDEDRPQRPNANYKLSKPDGAVNPDEEKLEFYYNRERRLAKAPPSVRNLYVQQKQPNRFNLLRPLVADKPRAILFFTILIICAVIFLVSILGYFDTSYTLDGNKIEISGTVFEGATIVVLKKTAKDNTAYTGTVDIAVSATVQEEAEQFPLFYHRIFFTLTSEEEYRFVVPFNDDQLLMVLQSEKTALKISLKIE